MSLGKMKFNRASIFSTVMNVLVLLTGLGILSAMTFLDFPEDFLPERISFLVWFMGSILTIAGGALILVGPLTASEHMYKRPRYLDKEELDVYYDMGHKILIAYRNLGGEYTCSLKKIRALEKFRVMYYYKNKKSDKPSMRQLEIL